MTDIDSLQRFIFENAPIRGERIRLTHSFQTIIKQHNYPDPIKKLLGEALSAAGLLSALIKFTGRLTVQFRGKGKLKLLLAQCNNQSQLRGLVKWEDGLSYKDLMESFNKGTLVIMLDSGVNTSRYQGIVAWRGNSLTESIEGYFAESEQLATKIWLAADDHTAAGLLLQEIPGSTETEEKQNNKDEWERIIGLTKVTTEQLLHLDHQSLLQHLYPHDSIRIFESTPVTFQCTCSRSSGTNAILLLGKKEVEEELRTNQTILVTCDFCNKEYVFDRAEIDKIFAEQDKEVPPDTQVH